MQSISNIMSVVIVVSLLMANAGSMAADTPEAEAQRQELSNDIAQVRAIGKSTELANLENLAVELERKWFTKNKEDYGYMILEICGKFSSLDFKDDRQYDLARQYAMFALEKSYGLEEDNRILIEAELKLLMYVRQGAPASVKCLQSLAQKDDWPNHRRKEARLYFRALYRLEKAIDPTWDPNDPSLVRPKPPSGVAWIGGMSSEGIKDPKLRAEYEAALEEYRQKHKWHSEQYNLRKLERRFLPKLQKHLLRLYSGPSFDSKQLETEALKHDLQRHMYDKKMRELILNSVNKRLLQETSQELKK